MASTEEIKARTLELYDMLPIEEEERKARTDIRDEVFTLNQSFFRYVANHTFVSNPSVTNEDKFQSACLHFMEIWWWYKWPVRYRTDLAFSVFFLPRLNEMIRRELNEVKYSVRRSLCMEAGKQLGKSWTKVRYEDLDKLNLSYEKMESLKAIFGTLYLADIDDYEQTLESKEVISTFEYPDDNYDSIVDFLVHEMCEQESKLSDNQLKRLANDYCLDYIELLHERPKAEEKLYSKLTNAVDFLETQ